MYNLNTEKLIKDTPEVAKFKMDRLPQKLTKIYAKIVGIRRSFREEQAISPKGFKKNINFLRTLSSNLETLVLLDKDHEQRMSSAFVAATAQYLLAMIFQKSNSLLPSEKFTAHSIPSGISAMILYLISNSPADACEVSKKVTFIGNSDKATDILYKALTYLSTGELEKLNDLEMRSSQYEDSYEEAVDYLYELIFEGIVTLGKVLLGKVERIEQEYFQNVISLSTYEVENGFKSNYSGPYHLACLLEALKDELLERGVVQVSAPKGVEEDQWKIFLRRLALDRPYLWENHSEAIATGFLEIGNSAVLTFPTGAGKTTLSELKIAATLFTGKSVLYLVPTHALEDQVNKNLNELFAGLGVADTVEIGGEYTNLIDKLSPVSVMTPERCLTLLSVNPEYFSEVGLVAFDEFHLISGSNNVLERRSLDAMFCLLRLYSELPSADYLLISAMVENGAEIASWVEDVTGRPCFNFNSNWKPTRQLHGCVIFQDSDIRNLGSKLKLSKEEGKTKAPGAALKRELQIQAYQIFSLRNMWETTDAEDYYLSRILPSNVLLNAGKYWNLTSNRNEVAAELAAYFSSLGLKTLVFVDQPLITVSTAKKIVERLENKIYENDLARKYRGELRSLKLELGSLDYSHFVGDALVAVHHGLMLPLERRLNEQYFKNSLGPNVVVATATLAQGINLPAEIVIIAGDDRFDEETEGRKTVGPHEILNAAGRAGRAGSAAQGVVLIIPGEIVTFDDQSRLGDRWWHLKDSVFSKSDQCLTVTDPLTDLLDSLTDVDSLTEDQKNIIFRLSVQDENYNSVLSIFRKSLAVSRRISEDDDSIEIGIKKLIDIKNNLAYELIYEAWVENVSIKMAVEPKLIEDLGKAIEAETFDSLFELNFLEITDWMFDWLHSHTERIEMLFTSRGARAQLARALNLNKEKFTMQEISTEFIKLKPILVAYMEGKNYFTIENMIEGNTDKFLLRARHFILKLVPHLSYAFGVFAITVREKWLAGSNDIGDIPGTVSMVATAVREGFDSLEKLNFRLSNPQFLRVECHKKLGDN